MSGGTATAQTYIYEFKKFDINLTESEADEVSKVMNKLVAVPVEKLDDDTIANVIGGCNGGYDPKYFAAVAAPSVVACVCLGIGAAVCIDKCDKATKSGDIKKAKKYGAAYVAFGASAGAVLAVGPGATLASLAAIEDARGKKRSRITLNDNYYREEYAVSKIKSTVK